MQLTNKNILLLCAESARHTATVDMHVKSFEQYGQNNVITLDAFSAGLVNIDLEQFDVIVLHYSIVISLPQYVSEEFAERISDFTGLKILFIQDEYRWVDRTSQTIEKLGVSVIFTVVNEDVIRKIYRTPYFDNVRFVQTLTGFIPEEFLEIQAPAYEDRTLDIGYRARKLPAWCGSFAQEKWQIGAQVAAASKIFNLKTDIDMSEAGRIYGDDWIRFICNCKATLGTESGASFIDFTGLVHQEVDRYEAENPDASFEEISEKFLEGRDNDIVIHVISPRVFEAAALRTLMIMYPGTYSGVLKGGRHFVELLPDHSNFDEVVAIVKDPLRAGEIIENAYREVACSPEWTHKAFVEGFDQVVSEELQSRFPGSSPKKTLPANFQSEIEQAIVRHFEAEQEEYEALLADIERQKEEMARITEINRIAALKLQRRMRIINAIQAVRTALRQGAEKYLPRFISRPLIALVKIAIRAVKPILRKIF